jgi:probable F420-dependent oxidoreductase
MRFGLCSAGGGICTQPGVLGRVAEHAETAGLESLWVSEHLVAPDPMEAPSKLDPSFPMFDPLVALAYAAARTTTLRLGTGVIVLPLRNPLILAKELASLDVLSGGRVLVGIGVGYVEQEFRALGAPFDDRGERTDEYLATMQAIWTQERPAFDGRLFAFREVQAHPRPVQRPHPPIVIGGWSAPALRRAARIGQGWYGWGLDHDEAAAVIARLRSAAQEVNRDPALGEIEITLTPSGSVDLRVAERCAPLGVHRLNLMVPGEATEAGLHRLIDGIGAELVERV